MRCEINAKVKIWRSYLKLLSCFKLFKTGADRFDQAFAFPSLRILGIVFASIEVQVLYLYWLQMDCDAMDNSGSTSVASIQGLSKLKRKHHA